MNVFKRIGHWFTTPQTSGDVNRQNFINVQIDAIGVGFASAASPFLPVFLTRLGATNLEIGLLTSMPAVTGLLLSIPIGQFLQSRRKIIPWFSLARLLVLSCYALTGLIIYLLKGHDSVPAILAIWGFATIPQTLLAISFSVVMSTVAGPQGRYELMTRRWSILGLTTAVTVIGAGQILDRVAFPLNYQIVFLLSSLGGLVSYYFSSHLNLPEIIIPPALKHNVREQVSDYIHLLTSQKPFVSFTVKRFVFLTGTTLAAPLFPIYFVRQLNAPDSWIANINTAQTAILILGYFFWTRQTRLHGSRLVLLATTFGISFYPILTGMTHSYYPIPVYAGMAGIFQAGLNLVFFDELMKTFPAEYSATFVAAAQSLQYLSSILAPFLGTYLADQIGISSAFYISGAVSLIGFALFALEKKHA
jgi:MFS family permease